MSPTALTATIAPTMRVSPPAGTAIDAVPSPPFHRSTAAHFPDRRTGPRTCVAFCDHARGRLGGRAIPAIRCRPNVGPVTDAEVVQNRTRDDRHFGRLRLESDLSLVQVFAHAGSDIETERAAARQKYRMHLLHEVHRIEQIGFDGSGRGSTNIDAAHRSCFGKDDRAPRQPLRASDLTDFDPRNIGNAAGRFQGTDTFLLLA